MSQRNPNRRAPKNPNRGRRSINNSPPHPPVFDSAVCTKHRFRFQASAPLVETVIGSANLLGLLKMAASATTAYALFNGVRIRRVTLWGPPAADLVPVTVSLQYSVGTNASNIGNRPRQFSDTSVGATRIASVSAKPDPQSAASMWQLRSSTTISNGAVFVLNGPINTIVDVELDLVLQNGETAATATTTTGATAGIVYADSLDNGTLLVPLSWPVLP